MPGSPSGGDAIAAIDIGSNSIKMTIARWDGATGLREVAWASETVRLGAGIERENRLADDRIEAALATLRRFAEEARRQGASRTIAVATDATRAAENGPHFLRRVRDETGIDVRAIDGDEEARLTFRGLAATTDVSGAVVVADVGGGSTEVIGAVGGKVIGARSLRLGSGRLTDRLVPSDPPRPEELVACRREAVEAASALEREVELPGGTDVRLIVVGGTGEYLQRLVDQPSVEPRAVDGVLDRLRRIKAVDLAARLGIAESRARVLPAGVAIVAGLADALRPGRIEMARSGIRTGVLLEEFGGSAGTAGRPGADRGTD